MITIRYSTESTNGSEGVLFVIIIMRHKTRAIAAPSIREVHYKFELF